MSARKNIKGLTLAELKEFAAFIGERPFRGRQLYRWLYAKGARSFAEMTDLSGPFREALGKKAVIENLDVTTSRTSQDGTMKFLFRLEDGLQIESVLIPPERHSSGWGKRLTICVSTQVGCPLDCVFCATGTMGFYRNLTAGEIVDQILRAQEMSSRSITNLVFMGMGEPMLNYENVMKSIEIISDNDGLAISPRRMTISTAGYADKIRKMADERRSVKLAVSLHSLDDKKRSLLMPINKKFPVQTLVESLEYYYKAVKRRPTFEYIVLDQFNDSVEDVTRFVELAKRIPFKINLIPFHSIVFAHPSGLGAQLRPAPAPNIEQFAQRLREQNLTVMVRSSSGQDIEAACGQLAVEESAAPDKRSGTSESNLTTSLRAKSPHVVL